jgi:hypothetical protein
MLDSPKKINFKNKINNIALQLIENYIFKKIRIQMIIKTQVYIFIKPIHKIINNLWVVKIF